MKELLDYQQLGQQDQEQVRSLFNSVFTASESEQEGRLVSQLAADLCATSASEHVIGLGAYQGDTLLASVFLTWLDFDDPNEVFMLSPVAVSTGSQKQGIGQALIGHGVELLKQRGTAVLVTYGDPAFYSKIGFSLLSEELLQAPHPLSMPHGWLGLSLSDDPIPAIAGRPRCAEVFNDPSLW